MTTRPKAVMEVESRQAIEILADRTVRQVTVLLRSIGLNVAPEHPIRLPLPVSLHLCACMILWHWEAQGITMHREAGLPRADDAIKAIEHWAQDPSAMTDELLCRVIAFFTKHFAWIGMTLLGAEVDVGELGDLAAIDAVAEFLWHHRVIGDTAQEGQ